MKRFLILILCVGLFASCKKDKQDPTLYFVMNARALGTSDFSIRAPTSNSDGTFTYSSSDPSIATVSGDVISIKALGSTTITASQSGTNNFNSATVASVLKVVPTGSFVVGQAIPGGIVFYVDKTGQHGFMVSDADLTKSAPWAVTSTAITAATTNNLGGGSVNTAKIITAVGDTGRYAAKLCADYRGGGFNNWYLPTNAELAFVRTNMDLIGNIALTNYWSSLEVNATPVAPNANYLYMANPLGITLINGVATPTTVNFFGAPKQSFYAVRAVRAF